MTPVRSDVANAITGEADDRIGDLAALLARAGVELGEIWRDGPPYAAQIGELRTRLVERRINIAALGQFKRGKSTFLNALLGCVRLVAAALGDGPVKARLLARQSGLLRRMAEDMRRYALKRDGLRQHLTSDEEEKAAEQALTMLAGHRTLNTPSPWR